MLSLLKAGNGAYISGEELAQRLSLSRAVTVSTSVMKSWVAASSTIGCPIQLNTETEEFGNYSMIFTKTFFGLYNVDEERYEWQQRIS